MEYMSDKKISVAFYWHMHQPVYELGGVFLMPWVRLHAVKDYLDMVKILDKYPKLKLNINIVPALLDEIIQYAEKGFDDIHSTLTVSDIENLTESEKEYILNNFFNSKYETMVYNYPLYRKLFKKRFSTQNVNIDNFSNQEFSDLMALFNLSWIDPTHYEKYPELKKLAEKGENYTKSDRIKIIDLHKDIIKEIVPTYKKYIEEGRIELTTSPYYHPVMPVLCDFKTTSANLISKENIPDNLDLQDDAYYQVKSALDRIEEVFGVRPKGFWASEYCLTDKVLELFSKEGIKWTISDESILSKSINFEFIRDFKGNIEDPYYLLKTYTLNFEKTKIDVIFRDSHIPNLINFEYYNMDEALAANDLYNKIKSIQNKLIASPDENHLLTIALDGENCWENYKNDGSDFLNMIYSKLEKDDSIETVLISDYISEDKNKKNLNKIYPGSWINKDFNFWLGDPVKNLAWKYIDNVRKDLKEFIKEKPENENISRAKRELYITEGSDWFWWYGEPNNSGQDNVFDFLFREHLKNIYKLMDENYPEYLDYSIIETVYENQGLKKSQNDNAESGWLYSNNIDLLDGPLFHENKIFDSIKYGYDRDNVYFNISTNPHYKEHNENKPVINQLYIYFKNGTRQLSCSNLRIINKTESIFPILKAKYHNELILTLINNQLYPSYLSKSVPDNLWSLVDSTMIDVKKDETINIKIPFDDLNISSGEELQFFFVMTNTGLKNTFMPKDEALIIERP